MRRQNTLWIICLLVATAAYAKIKVPAKVTLGKDYAGFQFQYHVRYVKGDGQSFDAKVDPDGNFHWTGVNIGEGDTACMNTGGTAKAKVDQKRFNTLVIAAHRAIAGLNNDSANRVSRDDYQPPTISTEFNNEYGYGVIFDQKDKNFKAFMDEVARAKSWVFNNKDAKIKSLSIKVGRDFKSRKIRVQLTNSGTEGFDIRLPDEAGEHFKLQTGLGDVYALEYKDRPANLHHTLTPGAKINLTLRIPKNLDPATGLVVYDNTSHIASEPDDKKQNKVKVVICPLKKDGTRAEL